MAVSQAGADQLLQDGLGDGHHHGRGGRVAEPHGEKHGAAHEAQHQPEQKEKSMYLYKRLFGQNSIGVCLFCTD